MAAGSIEVQKIVSERESEFHSWLCVVGSAGVPAGSVVFPLRHHPQSACHDEREHFSCIAEAPVMVSGGARGDLKFVNIPFKEHSIAAKCPLRAAVESTLCFGVPFRCPYEPLPPQGPRSIPERSEGSGASRFREAEPEPRASALGGRRINPGCPRRGAFSSRPRPVGRPTHAFDVQSEI